VNLIRRYPATTINIGMGFALVVIVSLARSAYGWIWEFGGRSDALSDALKVFRFYLIMWGSFLILGLLGGFAGKWVDHRFGFRTWATIGMVLGMATWLVLVETYLRGDK
jgi:hypothetical protein